MPAGRPTASYSHTLEGELADDSSVFNVASRDVRRQQRRGAQEAVFSDHLELLFESYARIQSEARWSQSTPLVVHVGLVNSGGIRNISIGSLLAAWRAGVLQRPCRCGGVVNFYSVLGSELTGSHQAIGVCPTCRSLHCGRLEGVTLIGFVNEATRAELLQNGDYKGQSTIPFEYLPRALLGLPIACEVLGRGGAPIAVFDYHKWTMHEVACDPCPEDAASRTDIKAASSMHWALEVVTDSSKGQAGAGWTHIPGIRAGEQWLVRVPDREGVQRVLLSEHDGILYIRDRGPVALATAPVPRQALAHWAAKHGLLPTLR